MDCPGGIVRTVVGQWNDVGGEEVGRTHAPTWGTAKASRCKLADGSLAWDVDLTGSALSALSIGPECQVYYDIGSNNDESLDQFLPGEVSTGRRAHVRGHQAISCLGDNLATSKTSCPPLCHPDGWLDTRGPHIATCIDDCIGFSEEDKRECWSLVKNVPIYQRFLVYVFGHVRFCGNDQRQLGEFRHNLETWKLWDGMTCLLNHRIIFVHLWSLLRRCKSSRPTMHLCDAGSQLKQLLALDIVDICSYLAGILTDQVKCKAALSKQGQEAQALLDLLQTFLNNCHLDACLKPQFLESLFKLSQRSGLRPECLVLTTVRWLDRDPVAAGQYGEVWKCQLEGSLIAVKVLRVHQKSDINTLLKKLSTKASIWCQLSHPNVLPFYGVYHYNEHRSRVCLVSPWMENGTIVNFLERNPRADCVDLVLDVASGLNYLHTMNPNIVHGDLKGTNVFITPSHRACLADFGLATAKDSGVLKWSSSSNVRATGTVRWQAPELLGYIAADVESHGCTNQASDMYSFACVCYEVFSGFIPFHEIPDSHGDVQVITAVINGKRPTRPTRDACASRGLDDDIWKLVESCWLAKPSERPTAAEVVEYLTARRPKHGDARPCDWDRAFVAQLRSNLADHPFSPPPFDDNEIPTTGTWYRPSRGHIPVAPTLRLRPPSQFINQGLSAQQFIDESLRGILAIKRHREEELNLPSQTLVKRIRDS